MRFPLHPDFNDRDIGICDLCGESDMLYPDIEKNLCLKCGQTLFRNGGIIPYIEQDQNDD